MSLRRRLASIAVAATGCGAARGTETPVVDFEYVGMFDQPVDMAWRRGDDGLYVVERGLAFAPSGRLAYVNQTDLDGQTAILEYGVAADGSFSAERVVMRVPQPSGSHNGGDLAFGADGKLYIALGDGSAAGDTDRQATDLSSLLGKLLRIDPLPSAGRPYGVPTDNPFVDQDGAAPEIWASGLRNPWRFSFDRDTGDLWIGDVGEEQREELDLAPATGGRDAGKGVSFGWSAFEGDRRYNIDVSPHGHAPPFLTYSHDEGCSITGGVRARGAATGAMEGWYVFGDWCAGKVWALEVVGTGRSMSAGRLVTLGDLSAVAAVVDGPDGELYGISQDGPIFRLVAASVPT